MASSVVVTAVFEETFNALACNDPTSTRYLDSAFRKVEAENPGFSEAFLLGLLHRFNLKEATENRNSLLQHIVETNVVKQNNMVIKFVVEVCSLKVSLLCVPVAITNRNLFVEVIKDVANTLQPFLEFSSVLLSLVDEDRRRILKNHLRVFMMSCRKFSSSLKTFFSRDEKSPVLESASALVQQVDLILQLIKVPPLCHQTAYFEAGNDDTIQPHCDGHGSSPNFTKELAVPVHGGLFSTNPYVPLPVVDDDGCSRSDTAFSVHVPQALTSGNLQDQVNVSRWAFVHKLVTFPPIQARSLLISVLAATVLPLCILVYQTERGPNLSGLTYLFHNLDKLIRPSYSSK
ncbi:hypothetical protein EG68_03169 [Paragonimus skrjabini miyazakii]|uniref:Programmed cell death protein 10 dimerisation domain-containing protein n=1 Tax=Paragonimus skrjabini miyazakii TaxID=59628 RepID=A0A8S9YWC0_9TREM|nr:hypothetical protein EG68_03169 [Paragonimus skrjabini miyazakii]